jgi:hypothetical protein
MKASKVFLAALLSLVCASAALADTCGKNLTGPFPAPQANKLCATFLGSSTLSSTITPGTDNTYDIGTSSAGLRSLYADTSVLTPLLIPPGALVARVDADAQRLFTWDASSDTALSSTFGDAGVTATQALVSSASTSDADDDSTWRLCGGGGYAADGSRGACISLLGEEATGGGDITYVAGASDTHVFSAGSTETMSIGATGLVTAAAGVTATAGNVTATAGGFVASASGQTLHLQEATAGTKCMGTATANGTTAVTVSTTCALTASRIFISRTSAVAAGVTEPGCWATNIVNATSFDLDCNDAAEDSTFNWIIFQEAA